MGVGAVQRALAQQDDAGLGAAGDHHGAVDLLLGEVLEQLLEVDEAPQQAGEERPGGEQLGERDHGLAAQLDDVEQSLAALHAPAEVLEGGLALGERAVAEERLEHVPVVEQEHPVEARALEPDVAGQLVGVEGAQQLGEVDEGALQPLVDGLAGGQRIQLAQRDRVGVAVDGSSLRGHARRGHTDGGDGGLGHHGLSRRVPRRRGAPGGCRRVHWYRWLGDRGGYLGGAGVGRAPDRLDLERPAAAVARRGGRLAAFGLGEQLGGGRLDGLLGGELGAWVEGELPIRPGECGDHRLLALPEVPGRMEEVAEEEVERAAGIAGRHGERARGTFRLHGLEQRGEAVLRERALRLHPGLLLAWVERLSGGLRAAQPTASHRGHRSGDLTCGSGRPIVATIRALTCPSPLSDVPAIMP